MAGANVNAVSGGTEGRVGGVGIRALLELKFSAVRRGGVEQAAVGNQVGIPGHDQRNLTSACT